MLHLKRNLKASATLVSVLGVFKVSIEDNRGVANCAHLCHPVDFADVCLANILARDRDRDVRRSLQEGILAQRHRC